jgi:ankyrin repeat protein
MKKSQELTNNTLIQRALRADPIKNSDLTFIKELIEEEGADVNYVNPKTGYTSLLAAVESNNLALVVYLMQHGINAETINKSSLKGITPLWIAVKNNNLYMVKCLFNTGCVNINSIKEAPYDKTNPITVAFENNNNKIIADLIINFMILSCKEQLVTQDCTHNTLQASMNEYREAANSTIFLTKNDNVAKDNIEPSIIGEVLPNH